LIPRTCELTEEEISDDDRQLGMWCYASQPPLRGLQSAFRNSAAGCGTRVALGLGLDPNQAIAGPEIAVAGNAKSRSHVRNFGFVPTRPHAAC
jgi:hypothetical protein